MSQWTIFREVVKLHSATFYAAWAQILHWMALIIFKMEQNLDLKKLFFIFTASRLSQSFESMSVSQSLSGVSTASDSSISNR